MKIYLLTLLLFTIPFFSGAQKFLIMKNGDTLAFKNYKFSDDIIKIKTNNGRIEVKAEEVYGYITMKEEAEYVLKNSNKRVSQNYLFPDKNPYYFVKKIIDGKINVYEKLTYSTVQTGMHSMPVTNVNNYIEKHYEYEWVPDTKYGRAMTLKYYVSDNKDLEKKMENRDKINFDDFIKVIKEYNLSRYKPQLIKGENKSTVYFYLKKRGRKNQKFILRVNDNSEYEMPTATALPVEVSIDHRSKVCLVSDDMNYCEVITGSPYYMKFFEIFIPKKENKIEFRQVHSLDAQKYLSYQR